MSVYLSQNLEKLADALAEQIYAGAPFARRQIVVPHHGLKFFLMEWIARKRHVAAGLEILSLPEALPDYPSALELSLFIEQHFDRYEEVQAYLTPPGEKRKRAQLADRLSQLFLQMRSAEISRVQEWAKKRGWEQELWRLSLKRWPWPPIKKADAQLFVFGFTFLPPAVLDAFCVQNATFFLFSPSRFFWGDYYSDKERLALMRREPDLFDAAVRAPHPLLANLGRLCRQMQRTLDEKGLDTEDLHEEIESKTLLGCVQGDIVRAEINAAPEENETILLFTAPTKMREVECVKEKIAQLLEEGVAPEEICIFAPNISDYYPYIRALFDGSDGIDAAVFDLPMSQIDPLAQGFAQLLEFPEKRTVLSHPLLVEKWGGLDFPKEEEILLSLSGEPLIPMTELENFDAYYRLISSLKRDLSDLHEKQLTPAGWMAFFKELMETYFGTSLHTIPLEGEHPISYESAERIARWLQSGRTQASPFSHMQMIRCASLRSGAVTPCEAIILLGMDAFPRVQERSSLFPKELEEGFLPTTADEDRALFLQLLLSARRQLIISAPEDALIVQELASFLTRSYTAPKRKAPRHCLQCLFLPAPRLLPPHLFTQI